MRIDNLASRLTEPEREVRRVLLQEIIDTQRPVSRRMFVRKMKARFGSQGEILVTGLLEKRTIVLDDQDRIIFAYPVSAMENVHKVNLKDGRSFHPMCAIDAMGAHFTFHQPVTITSVCKHCQTPIVMNLADEQIVEVHPATVHVLHADLNNLENWALSC